MAHERDIQISVGKHDALIRFLEGCNGEHHKMLHRKLIDRDHLEELGAFCKRQNIRVAFATGTYDMIHIGHVRFLELARSLGDVLVVGLNSDESVRTYKDPSRPILGEMARAEMLSFLASVDYVTIYPETTGAEVIRRVKPDAYLCVEGSWQGDIGAKEEVVAMLEHGGEIFYTPRQDPHLSTSAIIEKVAKLEVPRLLEQFQRFIQQGNS